VVGANPRHILNGMDAPGLGLVLIIRKMVHPQLV
jgi:hypothetical protein